MRISDWSSDVCSSDLAEQRVVSALAVALEGFRGRLDLGLQLRELAGLLEQDIAFGRQALVDTLVIAAADIAEQLPQQVGIINGLRRHPANPGRCSGNDQTRPRSENGTAGKGG